MSITDPADILLNTITLDENIIDVVPKKKIKIKVKKKLEVFTYDDYINNEIVMKSYTIPILKQVCKNNKLHISGKKAVLIDRITTCFERIRNAVIVQKYTRKQFVKKILKKHKEFNEQRSHCTNNTDFSTMEPLHEISNEYFYCYTDIDNFVYGFDITSLISMLRSTRKLFNPYTRTPFTRKHKNEIIHIYNLSLLVFQRMREINKPYKVIVQSNTERSINRYRNLINRITNEFNSNMEVSSYLNYRPIKI